MRAATTKKHGSAAEIPLGTKQPENTGINPKTQLNIIV